MILDRDLLEQLEDQVGALIRFSATSAVLPRFGQLQQCDIFEKAPGELVTIADRESEEILSEGLTTLLPDARVIGEEAVTADETLLDRMDDGLVWIVDPLDGTANFASGKGPFGLIVALADQGETLAAWLYDPLVDRMCFAAAGAGARLTIADSPPQPLSVTNPTQRPVASLATQFMPPDLRDSVVASATRAFDVQPIPKCAAEHYPRLCLGQNHVAMFQRTLPWDHAAGALLLIESGGHIARWSARPYSFHDDDVGILAATSIDLWNLAARILLSDSQVHAHARELLPQVQDEASDC